MGQVRSAMEYEYPVRLPDDLRDALMQRAKEQDRPISRIIREALRVYLLGEGGVIAEQR
jgi:predicted transcriptional regulator